tara:strand:+ start:562 stop:801 length:240 start_codon:yes stop_codon:yes gene_type:complete
MKERQPGQIKYDTNKSVRSKIDSILHDCVVMFANVGTNTPLDVGTKEDAKRIEKEKLENIKDIDLDFYNDRLLLKKENE